MSHEPKKRSWPWVPWSLLAIFVLYPLSIGPAFWWANAEGPYFFFDRWETLARVYAPLFWLAGRCDCVGNAMLWYMERFSDWPDCIATSIASPR
jgi:hypothetical protein